MRCSNRNLEYYPSPRHGRFHIIHSYRHILVHSLETNSSDWTSVLLVARFSPPVIWDDQYVSWKHINGRKFGWAWIGLDLKSISLVAFVDWKYPERHLRILARLGASVQVFLLSHNADLWCVSASDAVTHPGDWAPVHSLSSCHF
jgi:hypothetical protein